MADSRCPSCLNVLLESPESEKQEARTATSTRSDTRPLATALVSEAAYAPGEATPPPLPSPGPSLMPTAVYQDNVLATAAQRPKVIAWFKAYCGIIGSLLLCYGGFCFFSQSGGVNIAIPIILLAGVCLLPIVIQPQPWLWTYGFVIICLGFTSCLLLPAGIPLLIFWVKPDVKQYYASPVATTSQLPPPSKVPEARQPTGDCRNSETPTQDIADTTAAPVIRKRPTGVSVVGWILTVMGGVSLLSMFIAAASTDYGASLAKNRLPVGIQVAFGFIGLVVTLFSGVCILKGVSWARWLYIGWGAFAIPVSLANVGFSWLIVPGLVFYALFTAVLLQKDSSAFFKAINE